MNTNPFENRLPYYLLLAFGIHFFIMAFLSDGSVGGADDIVHYKFSRYAFEHPAFFLLFSTYSPPVRVLCCMNRKNDII